MLCFPVLPDINLLCAAASLLSSLPWSTNAERLKSKEHQGNCLLFSPSYHFSSLSLSTSHHPHHHELRRIKKQTKWQQWQCMSTRTTASVLPGSTIVPLRYKWYGCHPSANPLKMPWLLKTLRLLHFYFFGVPKYVVIFFFIPMIIIMIHHFN